MNELPPHLAALVANARQAHEPSDADRERVFGALQTTLGVAAVATTFAHASTAAGAATTHSTMPGALGGASGFVAKWWLVGALAVAGTGLWTAWPGNAEPSAQTTVGSHSKQSASTTPPTSPIESKRTVGRASESKRALGGASEAASASTLRSRAPGRASTGAHNQQPNLAPMAGTTQGEAEAATAATSARTREAQTSSSFLRSRGVGRASTSKPTTSARARTRIADAARPTTPIPTDTSEASTQSELALVRATLTALRDGHAEQALELLRQHAAGFPQGAMAHERIGLRVVALCDAGQHEQGLREKAAFLRSDSSSALARRVRRACPVEQNEAGESAREQNSEASTR